MTRTLLLPLDWVTAVGGHVMAMVCVSLIVGALFRWPLRRRCASCDVDLWTSASCGVVLLATCITAWTSRIVRDADKERVIGWVVLTTTAYVSGIWILRALLKKLSPSSRRDTLRRQFLNVLNGIAFVILSSMLWLGYRQEPRRHAKRACDF